MEEDYSYIAEALKTFRQSRSYSLDEMAERSGVSRSMICQIENKNVNPTISVLGRLAQAMDISLGDLVDPRQKAKVYRLHQLENAKKRSGLGGGFICQTLNEETCNRQIEVDHFQFTKKGRYDSKTHGINAIEYIVLEKGEVRIHIGNEFVDLKEGDLLEFHADSKHSYEQISSKFASGYTFIYFGA